MWCAAGIRNTRYNNQLRNNERQIAAHIAVIRPQWEAFKRTNVGLEVLVTVLEVDGITGSGPLNTTRVALRPMEVQILRI